MPCAITNTEHLRAAQLGGDGRDDICHSLAEVLSAFTPHNPTSCRSAAVPSSPRAFLGWLSTAEHRLAGQHNLEDAVPESSAPARQTAVRIQLGWSRGMG